MATMVTVTLSLNNQNFKITGHRKEVKDKVISKACELCECRGKNVNDIRYTKLSKETNKYLSTKLEDLKDGDKIALIIDQPVKLVQNMPLAKSPAEERVNVAMDKILMDEQLTDQDRSDIYDFFMDHQHCLPKNHDTSSTCNGTIGSCESSPKPKRIKLDKCDKHVQTERMTRDQQTQENRMVPDVDNLNKYLSRQFNLPAEERDKSKFNDIFQALFPYRRAYMTANSPLVKVVKERHPYLFAYEQLVAEFEMIAQADNMFQKFQENVAKYSKYVLQSIPKCPYKKKIHDAIDAAETDEDKKWITMSGSLCLLSKYMDENRLHILSFDNEPVAGPSSNGTSRNVRRPKKSNGESISKTDSNLPYICCYGSIDNCLNRTAKFGILVEGMEVCNPTNIQEAFFGLMAAYYVFDVQYPDECHKTLIMFERLYVEYSGNPELLSPDAEDRIKLLQKHSS